MAVAKDKLIKVTNRYSGTVGYDVQDMAIPHRNFHPGETKEITFEELEKVAADPAGEKILEKYLVIKDYEAAKELLPDVEPEYYYTEEDIKRLLLTPNNLDAFLDCLDFAPDGVIDLIQEEAVNLPLNDVAKRKAILDKTGFNVEAAIRVKETKLDGDIGESIEESTTKSTKRRTAAPTITAADVEDKPQVKVIAKKN